MQKKRIKIITQGCKMNQYDSKWLEKSLSSSFDASLISPDLVIINTCSVTKSSAAKARNLIRSARKRFPAARLVVTGCWPAIYQSEADAIGADLVWPAGDLPGLLSELGKWWPIDRDNTTDRDISVDRSRYFIKIQEGCEQYCSYCIIPFARGKLRSRPKQEVMSEVEKAVACGYREIILSGTHLGLYGAKDKRDHPLALVDLVKELAGIDGLSRIRLSSIEVTEVNKELISLMLSERKLCRHLHIPLQAGSDKILRLMNRPYDTIFFKKKVDEIRQTFPEIAITTDMIVGFPGETKELFLESLQFAKKMDFAKIHVFPFSAHEKAPASGFAEQIGAALIKARAEKLRQVSAEMESRFQKRFVGQELRVIVEKVKGSSHLVGRTEYGFEVDIEWTGSKPAIGALFTTKL